MVRLFSLSLVLWNCFTFERVDASRVRYATFEALGRDLQRRDDAKLWEQHADSVLHPKAETQKRPTVVFRVLKARFTDKDRRAKFYAKVKILKEDGSKLDLERTREIESQYMAIEFNHACKGHPYDSTDTVRFGVYSYGLGCVGKGEIPVKDFFSQSHNEDKAIGTVQAVTLKSKRFMQKRKEIGVVFVQALMVSQTIALTRVDPELFQSPVEPLKMSGGTAPFYRLRLRDQDAPLMKSPTYYIGKDLSRASDEIDFYEAMRNVKNTPCGAAFTPLLEFALEYLGVAKCKIAGVPDDSPPKDLIVMRNLFDGAKGLRLLDMKIGKATASVNWKGKSRIGKWMQNIVDRATNSMTEGYRLEGFDGVPEVLQTMRPLFNETSLEKKATRMWYQTMTASSIFTLFLALAQQEPGDQAEKLSPTEYAEIVQSEICTRLLRLSVACRLAPAPQKWVGSSVALGFDAEQLPLRSKSEKDIREDVRVHIFDWGRSELSTVKQYGALTDKEKQTRSKYWGYYISAIDRLAFEAARIHDHRFCNTQGWKVQGHVFHYSSETTDVFLGMFEIPLTPTKSGVTAALLGRNGKEEQGTVTYSVAWRDYPAESRLKGAWRVTLVRAQNLPIVDLSNFELSSDPYVMLRATSADRIRTFEQQTTVIDRNLNPEWAEVLEVPVAKRSDRSCGEHFHLLEQAVTSRLKEGPIKLANLMNELVDVDKSLAQWKYLIDLATVDASKSVQDFAQWPSRST